MLQLPAAETLVRYDEARDSWGIYLQCDRDLSVAETTETTSTRRDRRFDPPRLSLAGKPVENAFIESFNGRLRDECLNVHSFLSIAHAQELIADWQRDYNDHRPHGALGHLTPSEYANQRQMLSSETVRLHLTPV
jgi:putative transposase